MGSMYMKRLPRKNFRLRKKKHKIICERCGKEDFVDFVPKGTAPVFCEGCYRNMRKQEKRLKRTESNS
ncbi:MAG: hypothetical protein DRO99_03120 [Candidatus Aenigmatarchaeota archaeon]|nr:MAG: hypothetical protein DRO99_03120 [Candidatus Aenigmarchaeota archaeon]